MKKLIFILFLFLIGCSISQPVQESSPVVGGAISSTQSDSYAKTSKSTPISTVEQQRQGLGTAWGETRHSDITKTSFVRASNSPLTQGMLYYNDYIGIQKMTGGSTPYNNELIKLPTGHLSFGLMDSQGNILPNITINNQNYVAGNINSRYVIFVQNYTPARVEVVLSVDGLDVMDGKAASLVKRGYLIDPFGQLKVDGFRQSDNTVAAFRFSSVPQSYAQQKHGDARNVGVIGIAAFEEQGTNWQQLEEVQRRKQANPFPNGYATPP